MKILILIITPCLSVFSSLRAADRPNILWITSEDNGWNWLGCYGNPEARTPRLDALAASGFLFSHAYSNAPVCAVARSTILNGPMPPRRSKGNVLPPRRAQSGYRRIFPTERNQYPHPPRRPCRNPRHLGERNAQKSQSWPVSPAPRQTTHTETPMNSEI